MGQKSRGHALPTLRAVRASRAIDFRCDQHPIKASPHERLRHGESFCVRVDVALQMVGIRAADVWSLWDVAATVP